MLHSYKHKQHLSNWIRYVIFKHDGVELCGNVKEFMLMKTSDGTILKLVRLSCYKAAEDAPTFASYDIFKASNNFIVTTTSNIPLKIP